MYTAYLSQSCIGPNRGPYHVLPLRVRVALGVMPMKFYFAPPKVAASDSFVSYPKPEKETPIIQEDAD